MLQQGIDGDTLGWATYEALTALTEDQLSTGLSVILDAVAWTNLIRNRCAEAAEAASAQYRPIELMCSDTTAHRRRVAARQDEVEGKPDWKSVERSRDTYWEAWIGDRLVIDTAEPMQEVLARALAYIRG